MSIVARMFGGALWGAFTGRVTWGDEHCYVALMDSTWGGADQDSQVVWGDISTYDLNSTSGYVAGGKALGWTNAVIGEGSTTTFVAGTTPGGTQKFWADDIAWTGLSGDFRYAVVYYNGVGGGYAQPLIGYVDFLYGVGGNISANNQTFTIKWNPGTSGYGLVFSVDLDTV